MADDAVTVHVLKKAELRSRTHPPAWDDPEGFTGVAPHHRVLLEENPYSDSEDDPVRAYVLVGNQVAGRLGLMMSKVRVRGTPVPVLWGFNLIVSPRFRGRGLATKLLACWQHLRPTAIGMHVNLASVGIYRKLGWIELTSPGLFAVHRSLPLVRGFLRWDGVSVPAASAVDAAARFARALGGLLAPSRPIHLRAEPVSELSPELDPLMHRYEAPAITMRSAAWVNWQLRVAAEQRDRRFPLYLVRAEDGRPVGYFLMQISRAAELSGRFRDVEVASLRDWGVLDPDCADLLRIVLLATEEAVRSGAHLTMLNVPEPESVRALRRMGFVRTKPTRTLFYAAPSSPLSSPEFRDPSAWRMTPAEGDGLVI